MGKTNISWATKSLNWYNWYCTKVSAGCKNCYMFAMRKQFGREDTWLKWRANALKEYNALKPGDVVFVNSMSDTYHEDAPLEWIQHIHQLAVDRPDVTFLHLTKRIKRVEQLASNLVWPDNLWLGTSIESIEYLYRINFLVLTPAKHKFISAEPLLESLVADSPKRIDSLMNYYYRFDHIDWVIVGGESGGSRRPFDKEWAREIKDFCHTAGTHFTFKQGSSLRPGKDCELDGHTYLTTPFTSTVEEQPHD